MIEVCVYCKCMMIEVCVYCIVYDDRSMCILYSVWCGKPMWFQDGEWSGCGFSSKLVWFTKLYHLFHLGAYLGRGGAMGVAPSSWNIRTNNKHVISTVLKVMYQHIKIVALNPLFYFVALDMEISKVQMVCFMLPSIWSIWQNTVRFN